MPKRGDTTTRRWYASTAATLAFVGLSALVLGGCLSSTATRDSRGTGGAGGHGAGGRGTGGGSSDASCATSRGSADCTDLATSGDWIIAKQNADSSSWSIPGGGVIEDGEYDVVAIESTKRPLLPTKRALRFDNASMQFDGVVETQPAAAEVDAIRGTGGFEIDANELRMLESCHGSSSTDVVASQYELLVEPGGFRLILDDDSDPTDRILYVYRQRCGTPIGQRPGDALRPRVHDIATALCAKMYGCCLDTTFISGSTITQSQCVDDVVQALSAQISALPASIAAGRSALSSAALDQCLAALPALDCSAFGALIYPASPNYDIPFSPSYLSVLQCPELIAPLVGDHQECTQDFECKAGRCRLTATTIGAPSQCIAGAALDEPCGFNGAACDAGLFCAEETETCHRAAPEGGTCEFTYGRTEDPCQPGLYCMEVNGSGVNLVCARPIAAGAACDPTGLVPCAVSSFCCLPNTPDGSCSGISSNFRCIPQFPDGHLCSDDQACLSGHCDSPTRSCAEPAGPPSCPSRQ